MNYKQARIFCLSAAIILILICIGGIIRCTRGDDAPGGTHDVPQMPARTERQPSAIPAAHVPLDISPKVGNLASQFNDMNDAHLVYARKIGIRPIESTKDIMKINRPMTEIEANELHHIDDLSHSYPYLVSEAAELLDTIGSRFNAKLAAQNGGKYHIKVTSMLRTRESINRLKKGNVNSTENSTHLYGTTFDISYAKFFEEPDNKVFHTDGELKNTLADVLLDLRASGKCLVKYERKQGCFHITATGL